MQWADGEITGQIADRRVKLRQIVERRADVRKRQGALTENLDEIENLHNRFVTACRRAEDEGRWPVHIAGHIFEQRKAQAIIDQTRRYLDERRPIAQDYDRLITRFDEACNLLNRDIKVLGQLKERLAIDLEHVRLDRGNEELKRLREMGAEIEGLASTLGTQGVDPLGGQSLAQESKQPVEKIDVEEFLK
jgi:hypothetical protein